MCGSGSAHAALRQIKVASRVSNELTVGWVIDGLDADDLGFERRCVFGDVAQEMKLRRGRANQQHLAGRAEDASDIMEEVGGVARVMALGRRTLGVSMNMVGWRGDGPFLEGSAADAKDARLLVIDPNDGVLETHV
jgi:hypothetical protein